jgi:hypothetical protein
MHIVDADLKLSNTEECQNIAGLESCSFEGSRFLRGRAPGVLLDLAVVSISCEAILAAGMLLYGKYYKI